MQADKLWSHTQDRRWYARKDIIVGATTPYEKRKGRPHGWRT